MQIDPLYWFPIVALFFASLLFTALHMGWASNLDLIFVFLVALFYGLRLLENQEYYWYQSLPWNLQHLTLSDTAPPTLILFTIK